MFCVIQSSSWTDFLLPTKSGFTEKNLNKGELRPEIAYLICSFAGIQSDDVVLEPFCGYGSIPVQLAKRFNCSKIYASDIDKEKVDLVNKKLCAVAEPVQAQIDVRQADAMVLPHIPDNSIDKIITDPPWGLWENIPDIQDFYNKMFVSFRRVIKQNGKMIILSARTHELESAVKTQGLKIEKSLHTLVNGKKANLCVIANHEVVKQSTT